MLYIVFVKGQVRKISKSKDKNAYNIIQIWIENLDFYKNI